MIEYSRLPEHMQAVARDYVEKGFMPGDFFQAVLENNLVEALGRADEANRAAIFEWAVWLHNEAPMDSWGSAFEVREWIQSHERDRERAGHEG